MPETKKYSNRRRLGVRIQDLGLIRPTTPSIQSRDSDEWETYIVRLHIDFVKVECSFSCCPIEA